MIEDPRDPLALDEVDKTSSLPKKVVHSLAINVGNADELLPGSVISTESSSQRSLGQITSKAITKLRKKARKPVNR